MRNRCIKISFSVDAPNLTPVTPRGKIEFFFLYTVFMKALDALIKSCKASQRIMILKVVTFSMLVFSLIWDEGIKRDYFFFYNRTLIL